VLHYSEGLSRKPNPTNHNPTDPGPINPNPNSNPNLRNSGASEYWASTVVVSDLKPMENDAIAIFRCFSFVRLMFTKHFGGPGRAIGRVCVCVWTTTFEVNDL